MELTTALPQVTLRPFAMADLDDLVVHANDPEVARWLRDRFPHPYTRQDGEDWIAHKESEDPVTSFAITLDKRFIGGIGIDILEDVYHRTGEVGYWVGRAWWGRGIVSAAVDAICTYGFETLDLLRIQAFVFAPNEGSKRVLEKCGFTYEGCMRQAVVKGDRVHDELVYARLRDDEARR